jgi:phenylpyruvate tautomerase
MPLISVKTSAAGSADPQALLGELSSSLAELLGKPERYVMTLLETEVPMTFAGDGAPACYVEVKSIGALDGDRTRQVSQAVCELIERHLAIPSERTYIGFEDVPGRLWGWNGSTFG